VLGILRLLIATPIFLAPFTGDPSSTEGAPWLTLLAIFVLPGVGHIVAGVLLRRRKRAGGVLAIASSILGVFTPPVVGLLGGAAIIILVAIKWRELH